LFVIPEGNLRFCCRHVFIPSRLLEPEASSTLLGHQAFRAEGPPYTSPGQRPGFPADDALRAEGPTYESPIMLKSSLNWMDNEDGRLETMSAFAVTPAYLQLLTKIPPRVIRSEEQNDSYIVALYDLEQNHKSWSPDERELADLLTLLIEEFEQRHYALPRSSPAEALEFLMDQHSLKPADLADILGAPEAAAEILARCTVPGTPIAVSTPKSSPNSTTSNNETPPNSRNGSTRDQTLN